jgi:two-component system sensor histidine kinase ChvG
VKWKGPVRAISIVPLMLASNILVAFIVVAAFLSLDSYEQSLLESLEHALSQQARFMSAWLGETDLDREGAQAAVAALGRQHTARVRVVDRNGMILADSSVVAEAGQNQPADGAAKGPAPETSLIYRLFSGPARLFKRWFLPPQPPLEAADTLIAAGGRLDGPEIRSALEGRYGSATRISSGGQISVTLYSAVPVFSPKGGVQGAVVLSQSTYRILESLYALRVQVGGVFLAGLLAAAILTAALSLFIVRPIKSLARQARLAVAGGAPAAAQRWSPAGPCAELIDLRSALAEYSARLAERTGWAERFAQDAAHELRNPIGAVSAAAEYSMEGLARGMGAEELQGRLSAISEEARRMDRILRGLRRLSRLDAPSQDAEPSRAAELLENLAERLRSTQAALIELKLGPGSREALAAVDPERFVLAAETILDNAISFSPAGEPVLAELETDADRLTLRISDRGPGIPPGHVERVFERFFSYRPGQAGAEKHAGLGLSIAKAVAEAAGGDISASNRPGGGACFNLSFPRAKPPRRNLAAAREKRGHQHLRFP